MEWELAKLPALPPLGGGYEDIRANQVATPLGGARGASFGELLQHGLNEVGSSMQSAELGMSALAEGKPVEIHQVMINLERAQLSVQTFIQIRNKLVESFQDLMRMQM
jgi:flagellar hook-basal body complex protein FliE